MRELDLATIPTRYPWQVRETAQHLADELRGSAHQVMLAPAPRPRHCQHKIRVVIDRSPDWYESLLRSRPLRSRPRRQSAIKRCRILRDLDRISADAALHPATACLLLPLIADRIHAGESAPA